MCALLFFTISINVLSDRATGKKYKHKVNKGHQSVMQNMNGEINIVSDLAKYVTRVKAQLCASVA